MPITLFNNKITKFNATGAVDSVWYWTTWKIQKLMAENIPVCINPLCDQIFILNTTNNHWILFTNIDPYESRTEETSDLINRKWFIYDSLNNTEISIVAEQIMQFLYPDKTYHNLSMVHVIQQVGAIDCGLFTIAYAYDLSSYKDPSNLKYDQDFMRKALNILVKTNYLPQFESSLDTDKQRKLKDLTI